MPQFDLEILRLIMFSLKRVPCSEATNEPEFVLMRALSVTKNTNGINYHQVEADICFNMVVVKTSFQEMP